MLDVKKCLSDCEEKMDMSVLHLEDTLAQIRAGKANVHILDDLRVNSYGSMVPINNENHGDEFCHEYIIGIGGSVTSRAC